MPGNGHGLDLDERVPRRLRREGCTRDVFCMVKQTMSDDHLAQPPLLVYPQAFLDATQAFFNRINSTQMLVTGSVDEDRSQELLELAENISKDFPAMSRGVAYLRSLATGDIHRKPCGPLKFIESGPAAFSGLGDLQLGQRPPPPKPYKLKVVFHHLPAR